jgi:phosphoenolpyruvate carboxylase
MLHVGLFGYSRGVGKVSLPRAIPFTASLYSLGVPPEFIGTGRGLNKAKKKGIFKDVNKLFIHLKENLIQAGYFLNRENLSRLAKRFNYWNDIVEDISYIEKLFQIELGPNKLNHQEHLHITGLIYERMQKKKEITRLITIGGNLRQSLG